MTALDAANLLADRWPPSAMISPETGLPVCIETTRHVVEAFREAGVPEARPLPCAFYGFNRAATAQILGGLGRVPGAQRIEISPEAAKGAGRRRGWWGHLVVDHPEFLLDLVLPAVVVSTKAKGFEGLEPFCAEKGNQVVEVDGAWMAMTASGLCLRYEPRPRMAAWRSTDAWRGPVDRLVVENLAEHIRRAL